MEGAETSVILVNLLAFIKFQFLDLDILSYEPRTGCIYSILLKVLTILYLFKSGKTPCPPPPLSKIFFFFQNQTLGRICTI